jgi:hypothetical protein
MNADRLTNPVVFRQFSTAPYPIRLTSGFPADFAGGPGSLCIPTVVKGASIVDRGSALDPASKFPADIASQVEFNRPCYIKSQCFPASSLLRNSFSQQLKIISRIKVDAESEIGGTC